MLMKDTISECQPIHLARNLSSRTTNVRQVIQNPFRRITDYFSTRFSVARQRRELLALDQRALMDLGISRSEVLREAGRSFWDLPQYLRIDD